MSLLHIEIEIQSKMVHFNRNAIRRMVTRQQYIIPISADILFRICRLQTDPQTR